ncbi:hypothetical protein CHS0354_025115 [Potamilus streckersoni]|uniref:Uncharacterized protein n=1 Tax=Potamilus streckersoni TaxID=2493646 RepID=A0AAE0SBE8_9BIVA|nr:hypothetical protein CHS0354_025115 [Potamilus streckersoni]
MDKQTRSKVSTKSSINDKAQLMRKLVLVKTNKGETKKDPNNPQEGNGDKSQEGDNLQDHPVNTREVFVKTDASIRPPPLPGCNKERHVYSPSPLNPISGSPPKSNITRLI